MDGIIFFILLAFLIFLFWLRIKIFRPHWLANILFFAFVFVMSLMSGDTSDVSIIGAIVCTLIAHFWAKRVDKKKAAKAAATPPKTTTTSKTTTTPPKTTTTSKTTTTPPKTTTTSKTTTTPPKTTTTSKTTTTPPKTTTTSKTTTTPPKTTTTSQKTTTSKSTTAAPQKPVSVPQTLTTCVRCSRPLRGPKCGHCGFDHTAEPVYLLCLMPPQKLQIKTDTGSQS